MEREKGQTVTAVPCPNCGAARQLVAQPDGSLAQSACTTCYGVVDVTSKEVASSTVSAKPAREKGVIETPKEGEI